MLRQTQASSVVISLIHDRFLRSHAAMFLARAMRRHRKPFLLRLPTEVILQINSYLGLVSQACFLLSCKDLFNNLDSSILSHQEFSFPWIYVDSCLGPRYGRGSRRRIELLQKLQNKRWVYCGACYHLHSRNEPRINDSLSWPCLNRRQMVVALCPCLQLTYRNKLRLIEYIRRMSQNPERDTDLCVATSLSSVNRILQKVTIHKEKGNLRLLHHCAEGGIEIKTTLSLEQHQWDDDEKLVVRMEYTFTRHNPESYSSGFLQQICCCDHVSLFDVVRLPSWYDGVHRECGTCRTSIVVLAKDSTETIVQVTRNLGGEEWPAGDTDAWTSQCSYAYSRQI